ncbi:uncharacterized protein [Mytilus edulis]|uniref:uncharacterized protein isoform X27 n=1 Tax=Mytilus edulis TaxID=6550 RepID=UPI0039EDF540
MASSGGALNLSLLSRGIGEISKNGHEKIDVVFEPQDYFNFVGNSSRIYLPPIPKYDFDGLPSSTKSSHFKSQSSQEIPKTFTTRKGALLLYSEDQAHKVLSSHHDFKKARHRRPHPTEETLELSKSADELELKTVDDLAKSILSFGKREPTNDDTDVYLGFIHNTYGRRKKDLFERQIRPGFSAKRYLSLWTKSWDDNVLGKVISKGYLTEKSLFYYNPLNPHLQRRLNDDMSHFPAPYKLMRSMLMSPGSLSGYTFYRVRPESAETVVTPEQQPERTPSQMGSIKVISTKDGVQKEVSYSTLDKVAQEEVLTDLLVKSAVHYAMKKQQELMEGNQREEAIQEVDENRSSVQQFDMRDAVESLLDSQKSKGVLNTDFPEDKSEASSRSGSIKGKTLKRRSKDKATSPLPFDNAESEKEYVGSVPVASVRGDQSSVPQLPHISGAMPLTPIGEASREGTRMTIPVSLPPIGQDQGIDEFSDESGVGVKTERTERHYGEETERKRRVRKIKAENTGPTVSGGYHLHSSTESLGGPSSAHSLPTAKPLRTHWKGSTQSLKSDRSKKGYLISDQESDDEPDVWKRRRGVQREDMRNYAHKRDENSKEFTMLLSRATEKTEEGIDYPGDLSPDKSVAISHVSVPVAKPGTAPTDGHVTPGTPINTEDNHGLVSRLSRHEEEVFDDGSSERQMSRESGGRKSISRSKLSDKRRSFSQLEMRSGSKTAINDQGRRSSMSDAERKANTLSKREGRLSKVSIQSYSRTSSRHDPETPIIDPLLEAEQEHELDTPREDQEGERETNSLEKSNSHKSSDEGAVTPPLNEEKERETDGKESDKESRKKSQSSLGTVAPSRPGSEKHIVIPSGSDSTPSPTNEKPSSPALPSDSKVGSASSKIEAESGPTEKADHAELGPGEDVAHAESGPSEKLHREGSGQSIQSQQISEKDIINVLEDTARNIAASTLSRSDSGQDLEKDARQAAELWLEKNAPRIISRSQSVQDTQGDQAAIRSAVENGRKSAGPTAGEYKDLIKEKLQTALSNTDGESIPQIPDDAELSPELLEALKNNSITPEDIEIVKDEETGKSIVRSRSQMSAAMGGVKEGHIYVPVAKNGNKQHGTIPTDRQSNADVGEIEVINYGARSSDAGSKVGSARTHSSKKSEKLSDKAPSEKSSEKGGKSQPPSVLGESIVEEDEQEDMKSQRSGGQMSQEEVEEPEDEFKKALVEVEKVNEAEQKDLGRQSVVSKKSEKSAVSDKKSALSDDKKSVQTEKSDAKKAVAKKEEFVVGKVNTKGELEKLFGELGLPPNKPTTKKKGKPKDKGKKAPAKKPGKATKGKKAKDEEPKPTPVEPPTEEAPPKEPTPPPSLPPLEDKGASDNESDKESIAETAKSSESDFEFHFVRETPSPSPPPPPKAPSTIPSVDDEPTDDEEKQEGEDDEAARLRMISNREARAAKRAAQAAKRKEDVERKRREKEEQARRERDEHERAEQLKREMEAERRKTLDAKRQRKMEEDEEREREAQLEEEKMAKQKAEAEKERRRKEEYQRKLEEMKRKQAEEEQKRYEEMLEKQREEEERRKEEEEMMAKMAEEERLEYERKKKLEEEERKRKEEEDRIRREEEAKRAMEEARRLAEEMARKQAEMEARLKFNRTLQVEARGLDHSHNITEAFVFSYFELLNWFGLDVPEFELLKLNQY